MNRLCQKTTFIYELCEPDGITCRYVGVTVNLRQRFNAHLRDSLKSKCLKWHSKVWIRKLIDLGKKPVIKILETCEIGTDIDAREIWWIAHKKELGCDLTNHTIGGSTSGKREYSEEERDKISDRMRGTGCHLSKLDDMIVKEILDSVTMSGKELANKFNVHTSTISQIRRRVIWCHVESDFDIKKWVKSEEYKTLRSRWRTNTKLTTENINYILASSLSLGKLAKMFNVNKSTISNVKHHKFNY